MLHEIVMPFLLGDYPFNPSLRKQAAMFRRSTRQGVEGWQTATKEMESDSPQGMK